MRKRWPDGYSNAGFVLPLWQPAALTLVLPALGFHRPRRAIRRHRANQCPHCGYDVRATPTRCPECGTPSPAPDICSEHNPLAPQ